MANGMVRLGWKVPMVGSWALAMSNFIDSAGPNAEGARMPQTFIQESDAPHRRRFVEKYRSTYGIDRLPVAPAAAGELRLDAAARRGDPPGPQHRRHAPEGRPRIAQGAGGSIVMVYDRPFSKTDHEAIDSTRPLVMGRFAADKWSSHTTKTVSGTRCPDDPAA